MSTIGITPPPLPVLHTEDVSDFLTENDSKRLFRSNGFSAGVLDLDGNKIRGGHENVSFFKEVTIGGKSYVLSYEKAHGENNWTPRLYVRGMDGRLSEVRLEGSYGSVVQIRTEEELLASINKVKSAVEASKVAQSVVRTIEEIFLILKRFSASCRDIAHKASLEKYVTAIDKALAEHRATVEQSIASIVGSAFALVSGVFPLVLGAASSLLKTVAQRQGGQVAKSSVEDSAVAQLQRSLSRDSISSTRGSPSQGSLARDSISSSPDDAPLSRRSRRSTTDDANTKKSGDEDHGGADTGVVTSGDNRLLKCAEFLDKLKVKSEAFVFAVTMAVPQLTESAGQLAAAEDTLKKNILEALLNVLAEVAQEADTRAGDGKGAENMLLNAYSNPN